MIAYGIASYLFVKQRMKGSACGEANLIEGESIQSPFVIGLIRPKIYIPAGLSQKEREYIILHERTHIRRHDHIIKFMAYFILCLHWFNPLAWAAFLLMGVDIEMSCDERVLKELGGEIKKDYSMSLLSLATDRVISSAPLAFGEDGVKKRIKNVLKFRKPSRTIVSLAVAFVTVLSLGLMVSRVSTGGLYETPAAEPGLVEPGFVEPGEISDDTPDTTEPGDVNEIAPNVIESGGVTNAERVYTITDYYNEDGRLSDLALTLNEYNSEKVLKASSGDILIVGDRQYEVTIESLTLFFYTQPSHDMVTQWWTDYLNNWADSGDLAVVE